MVIGYIYIESLPRDPLPLQIGAASTVENLDSIIDSSVMTMERRWGQRREVVVETGAVQVM
jgi:hypothetical protein